MWLRVSTEESCNGSGQAPLFSIALGESGHKTVLIESRHVGGHLHQRRLFPNEAMIASAVAYLDRPSVKSNPLGLLESASQLSQKRLALFCFHFATRTRM